MLSPCSVLVVVSESALVSGRAVSWSSSKLWRVFLTKSSEIRSLL